MTPDLQQKFKVKESKVKVICDSLKIIFTFTEFTDASNEDNAGISKHRLSPVSYTHLTLPTKRIV